MTLLEAGIVLAVTVDKLEDVSARTYNLYPTTSPEVTVTTLVAVLSVPALLRLMGTVTLPLVAIVRDVSLPYGTLASYLPTPYGWAETGVIDSKKIAEIEMKKNRIKMLFTFFMLVLL